MARIKTLQTRFTQGEIDPLMLGRSDVDQYYGAAATLRNVFTLPQGGIRRRPGLEYIDRILGQITIANPSVATATNGGTAGNASDDNSSTLLTTTTNISTTNPYVVIHYDLGSSKNIGVVYVNGLYLTAGSSSEFYVQVSTNNSTWVTKGTALSITTTSKDFSRRVHGSYRYVRLVRIGSTDLGTAKVNLKDMLVYEEGSLSNTKEINFEFNVDQTYVMVLSDKNIAIYQDGVYLIDIRVTDYTHSIIPDIDWTQLADTMIIFHEDVQTKRLRREGSNDVWSYGNVPFANIPTYDFGSVTPSGTMTSSGTTGSVTITASVAVFTAAMVGWIVRGNSGYARITAFTDTTHVTATVIDAFSSTSAFTDWTLEEPIWSTTRGWVRHGAFYQNRLWVDGGKSRPAVGYGSKVSQQYDFNFGTALDDEAVGPILSQEFNEIQAIYPGRNIMFFTSGAEWIIPQPLGEPITPTNVTVARQSRIGSEENLRPQETEGGVFYIQRGGKSIQEFVFTDTQNAFTNNLLSLISSHLVEAPVDFALRKATNTEDGSYLLMVLDDGSLTVVNILRAQNIAAFTKQTTDGYFKNCIADVDDMYFVVQRNINGTDIKYLERFNNDFSTDCAKRVTTGLPAATFTGLDHLNGEECKVIADDAIMQNRTPSSGSVTIERNATSSFEIGLNYTPMVKDLPVEGSNFKAGYTLGNSTNISEVILLLSNTADIVVNGIPVSFRQFGPAGNGSPLDAIPTRFTGIKSIKGFRGWDTDGGQVTITQNNPLPFTLLALSKKVNT
jgi:hypothetical protein